MSLIQQLEALGQSSSMKEFSSAKGYFKNNKLNEEFFAQVNTNNVELICYVEPDDDED